MLDAEDDFLHRHPPLETDAGGIVQDQAGQEPQDQMPIVRVFVLHLAGLRSQQMLQRPEGVLNGIPPAPGSDQAWRRDGCRPAQQVIAVLAHGLDEDHGDEAIGRAGHGEPSIADPRQLRAVVPRPVGPGQQVLALDPTPIRQREDVRAFAFHDQGALLMGRYLLQQLRVPKPAISHHQGGWQLLAPPLQGGPGPVEHHLQPGQFITAGPAWARRVWATHHEVHWDDQLPVPEHHEQQQTIDTQPNPVLLTTPPRPYQAQLRAILLEEAVVTDPRPLPPTSGRRALVLDLLPQPHQQLLPQALQALDPLPLG